MLIMTLGKISLNETGRLRQSVVSSESRQTFLVPKVIRLGTRLLIEESPDVTEFSIAVEAPSAAVGI